MRTIPLTQGFRALVDDEDFEELSRFRWHAHRSGRGGYRIVAMRNSPTINGRQTKIYMHRQVLDAPPGSEVDHKDRNPLNNQKNNIRITGRRSNAGNRKLNGDNTSGFKGVHWDRRDRRWRARMWFNGKAKRLGYFDTALDGALVYDTAVRKLRDEHATTNRSLGLLPLAGKEQL